MLTQGNRTQPSRQTAAADADDRESAKSKTADQLYLHDHLHRMHNEIESTTRKLELEKRRLNKLEVDVARTRAEYDEKVVKSQQKETRTTEVRKLEHHLSKGMSQLNKLGHENKEARDKIDQIRRERLQMNQVFKKLKGDINDNIGMVSHLQSAADNARRDHEERLHRMSALKKQLDVERRQFKESVKKLQDDMKERDREDLIQKVAQVRASLELSDQDKKQKSRGLVADEEEAFSSTAVMRRILKLAFLNAIQRRHIRQHQKNIEVFEQAFATIKSTTGISDIEEIVKIFIGLEQRNFSLLTYVNTLNREIESLEKRNRELEDQIQSQKHLEAEGEKKRTETLAEVVQQIASTTSSTQENFSEAAQQQEVLDRCKPFVHQILKTVEKENRGFGGQAAPEGSNDNVLVWLTYIEKTLTQWKDFLPEAKDTKNYRTPNKNYKYTVGNQVLALPVKKHQNQPVPLVKGGELPSAERSQNREDDSDSDEDGMDNHPWTRQELRIKAMQSVAKRKKHRKTDAAALMATLEQQRPDAEATSSLVASGTAATAGAAGEASGEANLDYDGMVSVEKKDKDEDESRDSDESDLEDEAGPSDEEINEIFLKRYKMSREELQGMADKMGIQLSNLCYLKQEFDAYDEDRSGYIDVKELKELLEKLGEELSAEDLDQAFRELDSDGSGEIEFFEFVEWFTSED